MKITDKNGQWFTNTAAFRMHDPESDTYFESGETVKATDTDWIKSQPVMVRTDEEGNLIEVAKAIESEVKTEPAKVDIKK